MGCCRVVVLVGGMPFLCVFACLYFVARVMKGRWDVNTLK